MTDFETRSFRVPFELRMEGENQTIVGYASTFDQPYPVDMVTEIIDRSAFTRTLSEKPDVYALIGHDPSRILGRTKNGTLSLSIDERGLKCVITPVMTRDAEDTLKLIASGCIDAMSFGFKVVKQAFGYAEGKTTRRITDLELHEVSCVAFPANENATLSLRAKEMVTQFQRENRKTYDEVLKSTKAETTKGVKVDYTVFGTAKGESKGKKLGVYPTSAKAEAMAEKFKSKGYADINIVAYEDYSKGSKKVQQDAFDEAMGGRSAGAVETRATPATEGQQALNVENLKAEADRAEGLVKKAKATVLRAKADRMEALDGSMGDMTHLNNLIKTAQNNVTEAEKYAKETYHAFVVAEDNLRDMLRKSKNGNRSCETQLLELRNRIASPIDRK